VGNINIIEGQNAVQKRYEPLRKIDKKSKIIGPIAFYVKLRKFT
jgi:hypothetical protein